MKSSSLPKIRCRQIVAGDFDNLANLLNRGFRARSRDAWLEALERLSRRPAPERFPRYGYLLESGGRITGVLLTIFSEIPATDGSIAQCNISSWYVEPEFRGYAPLLTAQAQKYKDAAYINTSPADHTLPVIEAQGFRSFTNGLFVAVTAPTALSFGAKVHVFGSGRFPEGKLPDAEYRMLADHHDYGCLCLCCEAGGHYYPFIFRRRKVFRSLIPCAHLIFCRSIEELSRFAGPLTRTMLLKGMLVMTAGANGPIPDYSGRYFPGRTPMYYRGPEKPRSGNIPYTEGAIFGM
jgi:hypothetical protein